MEVVSSLPLHRQIYLALPAIVGALAFVLPTVAFVSADLLGFVLGFSFIFLSSVFLCIAVIICSGCEISSCHLEN